MNNNSVDSFIDEVRNYVLSTMDIPESIKDKILKTKISMNNIEENKTKNKCVDCGIDLGSEGEVFTCCSPCWDKHYKHKSPQPSDEGIERMASIYADKRAKPGHTIHIEAWTAFEDGFKSGLSYRSKEEWVSVLDRLPDVNVEVLALVRYKGGKSKHIITYRTGQGDWDSFHSESITHWQLLPPTDLFTSKQK